MMALWRRRHYALVDPGLVAIILWTHSFCNANTLCAFKNQVNSSLMQQIEPDVDEPKQMESQVAMCIYVGDSTNGMHLTYALLAWCSRARSILSILPV